MAQQTGLSEVLDLPSKLPMVCMAFHTIKWLRLISLGEVTGL
jgi:hypothetical protein